MAKVIDVEPKICEVGGLFVIQRNTVDGNPQCLWDDMNWYEGWSPQANGSCYMSERIAEATWDYYREHHSS